MRLSYEEIRTLADWLEDTVSARVLYGPEIDSERLAALNRIRVRLATSKASQSVSEPRGGNI